MTLFAYKELMKYGMKMQLDTIEGLEMVKIKLNLRGFLLSLQMKAQHKSAIVILLRQGKMKRSG
jgi:hypothetical protein